MSEVYSVVVSICNMTLQKTEKFLCKCSRAAFIFALELPLPLPTDSYFLHYEVKEWQILIWISKRSGIKSYQLVTGPKPIWGMIKI